MLDISTDVFANCGRKFSNLKKSYELYNFMFIVEAETREILCAFLRNGGDRELPR